MHSCGYWCQMNFEISNEQEYDNGLVLTTFGDDYLFGCDKYEFDHIHTERINIRLFD